MPFLGLILLSSLSSTRFYPLFQESPSLSLTSPKPYISPFFKSDDPSSYLDSSHHSRYTSVFHSSIGNISFFLKFVHSTSVGFTKMASKKKARMDQGQSSSGIPLPNLRLSEHNRHLFRDREAYIKFFGMFKERKLANCYYFDTTGISISYLVDIKLDQFIHHWDWIPLLGCQEHYTYIFTRIYYANLVMTNEPYGASIYLCGREIILSLPHLAEWLELPNEGEESYTLRHWPVMVTKTVDQYKIWFNRSYVPGQPLYASALPSLHRLLYLFINNIVTPKTRIKTNMEFNVIYYLRHLISLDDKRFNLPYIILRHMFTAHNSKGYHLPYGHLIHKIMRFNGIELPRDVELIAPTNLVTELTNFGWVQKKFNRDMLPIYEPDSSIPINNWIMAPNALPNQYWDPTGNAHPQAPHAFYNAPQPPPQSHQLTDQMSWIIGTLGYLSTGFKSLDEKVDKVSKAQRKLQKSQDELHIRWFNKFGASSTFGSSSHNDGDDIDEDADDES